MKWAIAFGFRQLLLGINNIAGEPGIPGRPGPPGSDGKPGSDGLKGQKVAYSAL